ncbi:cupin domain-containing protein (plasmid) [Diaphorobacter sp. HDW4B]|uniref:cupin domain-containing protein n=1 Tax=Diaphorobacter sp. HDW4B TaxID=2714925 RepID=UPI00140B73C1|nr:cupin domain-containing protein [Diaphorobacter sp. HDW4B]QIL73955.1 cupin domain-containing protein [Diaphorobacter sp. HDW4B]
MTQKLDSLELLYKAFDGLSVEGGWHRRAPALWPEPRKNFVPFRWRYADVKPILDAAGDLVDHAMADRRNLTMTNPVEGNLYATVRSMVAAYQLIKPGETADAHRHTPNALRIILEGKGTYTVVNGMRVEMRPGDVLLTPSWAWHSHSSNGNEDCYWVDVLDVPLVHLMEGMFFERHPDKLEPNVVDADSSPIAFRWEDSVAALETAQAPANGMAEREIQLGNPALRTVALHVQRLNAGFRSAQYRTTANSIFTVIQGRGRTVVDDEVIEWSMGDVIAVPAWRTYRHEVDSESFMVRSSDEPVMRSIDMLREEVLTPAIA